MATEIAPLTDGREFSPVTACPTTPKDDDYSSCSSRLSTPASRTPTPPPELLASLSSKLLPLSPSPSQQSSKKGTPELDMAEDDDERPPAKRRKTSHTATDSTKNSKDAKEAKVRTTEYLDLTDAGANTEQKSQMAKLLKVLRKKRKIVVIAGAGISVSAGIPDFRSSTGLFTTLKQQHNLKSSGKNLFDASVYKDDHATSSFHDMLRQLSEQTKTAAPTAFHHLLAELAVEGRLQRLYTQNIDGLDTSLTPLASEIPLKSQGGKWPKTIQVHGSLEKMVCTKCRVVSDFLPDLFNGPVPPDCKDCEEHDNVRTNMAGKRSHGVGKLRPRMVLYQEMNPDEEAIGSVVHADLKTRPDALIVVGTTLKVPGVKRIAKEMCRVVNDRKDGGLCVWISNDPPPSGNNYSWDLVVKGTCDRVAELANMPMDKALNLGEVVSEEDMERVRSSQEVEVAIMSPSKRALMGQLAAQLPTPGASPRLSAFSVDAKTAPGTPTKSKKQLLGAGAAKEVKGTKPTAKPKKAAAPRPRKAPTAANKTKPGTTKGKINASFKISKATKAADAGKPTDVKKEVSQNSADVIVVSPPKAKPVPMRISTRPVRTTGMPMAPLPPQEARNNTSPPFPQTPAEKMEVNFDQDSPSSEGGYGRPAKGIPRDARSILN